ncbi:alpha/beta hydrolase [Rothia nasimurium]|uniref:alpha/beta hydrolase n=1 Tax=Rothia nasimurium TaxID=85336 RepID=UPI001F4359BB|nr:alpha/beta hydrolase [Rothia nasimurium]
MKEVTVFLFRPQPAHRRTTLLTTAVLSASTLALAGCSLSIPSNQQPTDQALAPAADRANGASWQRENFENFYDQSISWGECTAEHSGFSPENEEILKETGFDYANYECGTVTAPLNWGDPEDNRTVELAVSRTVSTGGKQQVPLFTNPGGPGIGGIQHAMSLATDPSFAPVLESHQLWGFDPRGIGASSPVTCESDSEVAAVQLAECAASSEIANYMGTSQVARDMELLRSLAGGERLDYLGYSYGTMLGATYATLFPEKAGRMVLDSAENAQWGALTHNFDQMVAVAKAVGALADSCSDLTTSDGATVTCPFTSEREMLDYQKSLTDKPLVASDGTEITGSELRDYLTSQLYGPDVMRGDGLDLLGRAKGGDQGAVDELAQAIAGNSAEIDTAGQLVVCPSKPKTPDVEALLAHMKQVGVPEFIGGPELTDEVLAEFTEFDCAVLPGTGTDITTSFDASKVSTDLLVIGITGDHATPYQHGKELARQLGKASFVTLEGTGHGASFSGRSTCVDELATAYLVEGIVPKDGTVCQPDAPEQQ